MTASPYPPVAVQRDPDEPFECAQVWRRARLGVWGGVVESLRRARRVPVGGLDCGGGAQRVRSDRFVVVASQFVPVGQAGAPRLVRARARVARATARYSLGLEGRPVLIAYCSWAATRASSASWAVQGQPGSSVRLNSRSPRLSTTSLRVPAAAFAISANWSSHARSHQRRECPPFLPWSGATIGFGFASGSAMRPVLTSHSPSHRGNGAGSVVSDTRR